MLPYIHSLTPYYAAHHVVLVHAVRYGRLGASLRLSVVPALRVAVRLCRGTAGVQLPCGGAGSVL